MRVSLLALLLALAGSLSNTAVLAASKTLYGTVSHVTDGDTLWLRSSAHATPLKVRIDGIDAPEICQAYGTASRDSLAARVMGQAVQITVRRQDSFGRTLARVTLHGVDVGGWMVGQGQAWSYRYRRDNGPYASQEAQARARGLGLFADAQAQRPRDFRLQHGSCH